MSRFNEGDVVVIKSGLPWRCWSSIGLHAEHWEGEKLVVYEEYGTKSLRSPDDTDDRIKCRAYLTAHMSGAETGCWFPDYALKHVCMFHEDYDHV